MRRSCGRARCSCPVHAGGPAAAGDSRRPLVTWPRGSSPGSTSCHNRRSQQLVGPALWAAASSASRAVRWLADGGDPFADGGGEAAQQRWGQWLLGLWLSLDVEAASVRLCRWRSRAVWRSETLRKSSYVRGTARRATWRWIDGGGAKQAHGRCRRSSSASADSRPPSRAPDPRATALTGWRARWILGAAGRVACNHSVVRRTSTGRQGGAAQQPPSGGGDRGRLSAATEHLELSAPVHGAVRQRRRFPCTSAALLTWRASG
jgi:hypothetical protein